jgi:hypothetical protein
VDEQRIIDEIKAVLDRHNAVLQTLEKGVELRIRPRESGESWDPDLYGRSLYLPELSPFTEEERAALKAWEEYLDSLYAEEYPHFPQELRLQDVEILSHMQFYDGPLTGVARHNRQYGVYACLHEYPDHSFPREFGFWKVEDESQAGLIQQYLEDLANSNWRHLRYYSGRRKPYTPGLDTEEMKARRRELADLVLTWSNSFKALTTPSCKNTYNNPWSRAGEGRPVDGWFTRADTDLSPDLTREEEIQWAREIIIDAQIESWDHGAKIVLPGSAREV